MILKVSALNMCLIKAKDKSKHLSNRYSTMSKVTKTEFFWTDEHLRWLLLESVNQDKFKCEHKMH